MPYDTILADRVRVYLSEREDLEITEKKMFGGLAFLVNNKMCINISDDQLMCRFDPERIEEVAEKAGYEPMVMKGKHYKGYCLVEPIGYKNKKDFSYWIELCLEYNKTAKESKKRSPNKPVTDPQVQQYINSFSLPVKEVLVKISATIKVVVPEAEEKLAYGLVGYYFNGPLLYFGAFKKHIGIYPMPSAMQKFTQELSVYKTSKGAVQIPYNVPFPYRLLEKIAKYRRREQEKSRRL